MKETGSVETSLCFISVEIQTHGTNKIYLETKIYEEERGGEKKLKWIIKSEHQKGNKTRITITANAIYS